MREPACDIALQQKANKISVTILAFSNILEKMPDSSADLPPLKVTFIYKQCFSLGHNRQPPPVCNRLGIQSKLNSFTPRVNRDFIYYDGQSDYFKKFQNLCLEEKSFYMPFRFQRNRLAK